MSLPEKCALALRSYSRDKCPCDGINTGGNPLLDGARCVIPSKTDYFNDSDARQGCRTIRECHDAKLLPEGSFSHCRCGPS